MAVRETIQGLLNRFGIQIQRRSWNRHRDAVVRLEPAGTPRGRVLLAYIIDPFLQDASEPISNRHTHFWESFQMARTFLDLGFSVDAISYRNTDFQPKEAYTVFLAARTNFQRIAERLNPDCLKIAHMDMAHWLYNNAAALNRCLDLQRRRGVTIRGRKMQDENFAVEHADVITVLGNEFTAGTYRYTGKPIHRLPLPSCARYDWPVGKDFMACRRRFLWFGSLGMVHKGLDLALEAFAGMPDHHLTVCGPLEEEPEFQRAYHAELYETENINTVGWVDVEGPTFREVTGSCASLVYPSCSEGGGGSVIACMHAGVIPLVSYESSVDIEDAFGRIVADCSVEGIRAAVRDLSSVPPERLEKMARRAREEALRRYTRSRYAEEFRKVVEDLLFARSPELRVTEAGALAP
jgi:glycosyltransferase involved in cell wall biosynthesis